jgi:hypothetical protein
VGKMGYRELEIPGSGFFTAPPYAARLTAVGSESIGKSMVKLGGNSKTSYNKKGIIQ